MRQGLLIGLFGVTFGAIRALLHGLRYPITPPTLPQGLRFVAFMIGGLALAGGIVGVIRPPK